jgi:hypothetical protein
MSLQVKGTLLIGVAVFLGLAACSGPDSSAAHSAGGTVVAAKRATADAPTTPEQAPSDGADAAKAADAATATAGGTAADAAAAAGAASGVGAKGAAGSNAKNRANGVVNFPQ